MRGPTGTSSCLITAVNAVNLIAGTLAVSYGALHFGQIPRPWNLPTYWACGAAVGYALFALQQSRRP
jgi:hypothetical protein